MVELKDMSKQCIDLEYILLLLQLELYGTFGSLLTDQHLINLTEQTSAN